MISKKSKRTRWLLFGTGIIVGILLLLLIQYGAHYTSRDEFCSACHIHPHATTSWKQSTHYDNNSGIYVHCVECHLPPGGLAYYTEKAKTGARDVWGKLFKDPEKLNWELKSKLEHAKHFTYEASCTHCHQNLFPLNLNEEGRDAHLYYDRNKDKLRCLNCHLHVGHYSEEAEKETDFLADEKPKVIYEQSAQIDSFTNFTEYIPGTSVKFDMVAIPGGSFTLGSPPSAAYREQDEGPQVKVDLDSFWMAKMEVTWEMYEAFYKATTREGRTDTQIEMVQDVDAITGPTPPYGSPDQNWGRGKRPAITMRYHAATVFCEWLSKVTDKTYRLPTEAEWEYACRGETSTPYFFEGSPKKYTEKRLWNKIFGVDTTTINSYVIYERNSGGKTQPPSEVKPNPFGLYNMLGNVSEFCSDWYAPDAYDMYSDGVDNPTGPPSGDEHVIRGGSFKSDATQVRCANREHTKTEEWMVTDPQMPKSIWWYSDCTHVGFRIVCEVD